MDARLNLFTHPVTARFLRHINAYNRVNVIVRQPAGDYHPGQLAELHQQLAAQTGYRGSPGWDGRFRPAPADAEFR